MREEEKIEAGLLFSPADPELKALKLRAHGLNLMYNRTYEDETERRQMVLSELLAELGEGSFLQGPIFFHYGVHTTIGRNFFANFNLTIQDDAKVTIKDRCNFGPGVTIVTPVHPMVAQERAVMYDENGQEKHLC